MSISLIGRSIAESATLKLNETFAILKAKGEPVIHLGGGEPKSKSPIDAINNFTGMINLQMIYKNLCLELLLHLIHNDCYLEDDTISLALAFANNYLYYWGNNKTKEKIKTDIINHFFYIRIF